MHLQQLAGKRVEKENSVWNVCEDKNKPTRALRTHKECEDQINRNVQKQLNLTRSTVPQLM